MTTAAPQGTGIAPAAPVTPAPEVAPVVPAAPAEGAEIKLSSQALKERLAEASASARKALLKEFGLEKQEDLKVSLEQLKALRDEKLTAEERTKKQLEELGQKAKDGELHSATAQAAIDLLFAGLTDAQRTAIEEAKPANATERLRLIQFARTLGGAQPAPQTQPSAPPPPATTTPPTGAPPPRGQKSAYEIYAEMPEHSLRAAAYYQANGAAIEASRPTSR